MWSLSCTCGPTYIQCKWHIWVHNLFTQTLSLWLVSLSFSNTQTRWHTVTLIYRDVRHFIFTPSLSVPRLTTSSTGQPAHLGPAWTTPTQLDQTVCGVTFVGICYSNSVFIHIMLTRWCPTWASGSLTGLQNEFFLVSINPIKDPKQRIIDPITNCVLIHS